MSQFLPCPSCNRHVRVEDPRCPFCETALPARNIVATAQELPARGRVGRIAVLAAGAALVSGAAVSCDSATTKADAGTGGQTMNGTGGGGGGQATGSGGADGGQSDVPIYAAAVALPRNRSAGGDSVPPASGQRRRG